MRGRAVLGISLAPGQLRQGKALAHVRHGELQRQDDGLRPGQSGRGAPADT